MEFLILGQLPPWKITRLTLKLTLIVGQGSSGAIVQILEQLLKNFQFSLCTKSIFLCLDFHLVSNFWQKVINLVLLKLNPNIRLPVG